MAESGGTTTQSGIYYQNSIAALYLGRLVDSSRTNEETIESVRVEAPEAVDDVVVTYSNGKKEYIQAKERLSSSSEEWKKLWGSFKEQADICNSKRDKYSLILAISNTDSTMQGLKELCERAKGKENTEEWIDSLNTDQTKIVTKITQPNILSGNDAIYDLLKTVEVKVMPLGDIEKDYCPNYIPNSNGKKKVLYSILRDMIGGNARIRRSFTCSKLLEELLLKYEIEVEDSPHWGVPIYKKAIQNEFHILSVPGTELHGDIDELFLWPELYENSSSDYQDFEFEDLRSWREIKPKSYFELKDFPNSEISQAVINAGAGLGKTTLLKAISYKLSQDKIKLPVFIPLSTLIESSSVISYLNIIINDTYHVRIDWSYICSAGRVAIFFDGLDELSNTERQNVLDKIIKHIARFPKTDFLLTVRDSAILTKNLDVKTLEIRRLSDEKIVEFSKSYNKFGAKIDGDKLLEHTKYNTELMHLLRIPLFLSLVLATFNSDENLPTSRTEILEQYLDILFLPEHKPSQGENNTPYLREVAEYLAYQGLIQEHIGFNEKEILRYLRSLEYCDNPKEYLENLHKYGIVSKVSSRWQFAYPTIQEYLAAQYIVENKEEEIINGFEKIISRPWAQTIQFALESYPKSNEIIKEQIQKDDDAFFTSLRLISRCVVNGAIIDSDTRKYLGELLAEAWLACDSSSIMKSIGNLLLDGFIYSLPKNAEEYIIDGEEGRLPSVGNIELTPTTVSFVVENYREEYFANLTYTIQYYDIEFHGYLDLAGYIDIPITSEEEVIVITGLSPLFNDYPVTFAGEYIIFVNFDYVLEDEESGETSTSWFLMSSIITESTIISDDTSATISLVINEDDYERTLEDVLVLDYSDYSLFDATVVFAGLEITITNLDIDKEYQVIFTFDDGFQDYLIISTKE